MSKVPRKYKFVDLSDYGRFVARWIAAALTNTSVTPIQVTTSFIVSGLLAIICIIYGYNFAAAFFLILKSILDAADGELSRMKNMPSYIGRYYDSIADIILNFLFLLTLCIIHNQSYFYFILAFVGVQLQGTLYNYYYVILRNSVEGDTTSRIIEDKAPKAMAGESQERVDLYFKVFNFLYKAFDKSIYYFDKAAFHGKSFPKWFMTCVSMLGLGSQLLIMSVMLVFGIGQYIIPFFIFYSLMIVVLIGIRRLLL